MKEYKFTEGFLRTFYYLEFLEDWENIPLHTRGRLLQIMSRISEESFRRGVCQCAACIRRGVIPADDENYFYDFKNKLSINNSPQLLAYPKISIGTSEEGYRRFKMEYDNYLKLIGIRTEDRW